VWLTRACLPAALQVFRHVLGQPNQQQRQQQNQLLFTEADAKHFVTLTHTKDWRYVLINSHAKLSSEVRHRQRQVPA
jgi:protease II